MITFKAKTASGEIINSSLSPFNFPAGEAHIKVEDRRSLEPVEIAIIQPDSESIHDDLFQLAMWDNYITLSDYDTKPPEEWSKRVLILPYVPGARADRGIPYGLDVYSDFINKLHLDQVIIFDPHSSVTVDVFRDNSGTDLSVVSSADLFSQVTMKAVLHGYDGIIAPDKGAVYRASDVAELAGLPVYTAEKTRDFETGKLNGFKLDGLSNHGTYLIVDDICDGGGTFLGLADALGLDYGQLDLFVSHGVFSKDALKNLAQVFGYVFTTNSYNPGRVLNAELDYEKFRRFDIIRLLLSKVAF